MPYNEKLADRIRDILADTRKVEEKRMMGGICFMVDGKMCVGVDKDALMVRCDPQAMDELFSRRGTRVFDLTGKPMKGWLLVDPAGTSKKKELAYWINVAMEFNKAMKRTAKR